MKKMEKRIAFGAILTLLLLSVLILTSHVIPAFTALPVHNIDTGKNYAAIQEAIDDPDTSNGHIIFAESGIYYEHVAINKSISLIGENKNTTVIDGEGYGSVARIRADNVNMTGFTLQNSGSEWPDSGIRILDFHNITISDNILRSNYDGIFLSGSSNINVSGNILINNSFSGITLDWAHNNTVSENTITNNEDGIFLYSSRYNVISGNNVSDNQKGILLLNSRNSELRANSLTGNTYNFGVEGDELLHFVHDVETSNTVNEKSIYYIINQQSFTINSLSHSGVGYLALISSHNITIEGLELKNNIQGVLLANTTVSRIMDCSLSNNAVGILLYWFSDNNTICGNNMTNNEWHGIYLEQCSNNTFYHNSFVNNTASQVYADYALNFWDNGYHSGGNFWSDGVQTDTNGDGLVDTSYIINVNNTDRYPLMSPYWYWRNPIVGDLTKDMKVDIKDIAIVAKAYGSEPGDPNWNLNADITGPTGEPDGKVDIRDLALIAINFGKEYTP